MLCDQNVREKMEILVELLMMLLLKTFIMKLFAQTKYIQKSVATFRIWFSYSKYDVKYSSSERVVLN